MNGLEHPGRSGNPFTKKIIIIITIIIIIIIIMRDMLSTVQARPPEFAKYSASAVAKSVGDGAAQPPWFAKYGATAVATTVEKSIGGGEAGTPGTAKYMATAKSGLAEPPGELHEKAGPPGPEQVARPAPSVSTVAKPVDGARSREFAEYSVTEDTDVPGRSNRFTLSQRTRNACLQPSQRTFGK